VNKIREQQSHSNTLLEARLQWYRKLLDERNLNVDDFILTTTTTTTTTTDTTTPALRAEAVTEDVTTGEEEEEPKEHKDYKRSLSHLKSVMNSLVSDQPAMNTFTATQNSYGTSCARQSMSTTADVNKNYDGPHISKPPMLGGKPSFDKVALFSGFDKVGEDGDEERKDSKEPFTDIEKTIDFQLWKPVSNDQTVVKMESDDEHIGETETITQNGNGDGALLTKTKKKKKKKKSTSGTSAPFADKSESGAPLPEAGIASDGTVVSEIKKKKANTRAERRKLQKMRMAIEEQRSERGQLEDGGGGALVVSQGTVGTVAAQSPAADAVRPRQRKRRVEDLRREKQEREAREAGSRRLMNIRGQLVIWPPMNQFPQLPNTNGGGGGGSGGVPEQRPLTNSEVIEQKRREAEKLEAEKGEAVANAKVGD